MAYGSAKGRIFRGDIYAEDDPNQDTYIDWGNDFISFGVGGVKVLNVSASDTLVQVLGNVSASLNITASGHVSASTFFGDGQYLKGVTTSPASPTNAIQFNNAGAFGGTTNLRWEGSQLIVSGAISASSKISGTTFYGSAAGLYGSAAGLTNTTIPSNASDKQILVGSSGFIDQNGGLAELDSSYFSVGNTGFTTAMTGALHVTGAGAVGFGTLFSVGNSVAGSGSIFTVTGSGRVGINNTDPNHTLAISGSVSASSNISASAFYGDGSNLTNLPGGGGGGIFTTLGSGGAYTTSSIRVGSVGEPSASLYVSSSTAAEGRLLRVDTLSSGTIFFVTGNLGGTGGAVGINTLTPNHTLAISGNVSASSTISASAFYGDGSNLTNLPGGGGGGIFTTLGSGGAYTTSSIRVGSAGEPSASLHVSGSGAGAGPVFRVDSSVAGGTPLFFVSGSGRVGIGTAAPTRQLDIEGTSDAYVQFNATTPVNTYTIGASTVGFIIYDDTVPGTPGFDLVVADGGGNTTKGYVGIGDGKGIAGSQYPSALLHLSSSDDGAIFRADTTDGAAVLFVTGSGKVGIGTSSPDHTLTVAGNVSASSNISASSFYGDGSNLTNLPGGGGGGIFTTLGSGGAYTTSSIRVGSAGEPSASLYVSASAATAGQLLRVDTASSGTIFFVTGSGRVGIGTDSPTEVFEVNPNTDVAAIIGRARVGSTIHPGAATFGHLGMGYTEFALYQNSSGLTILNAKAAQAIYFRINNVDKMHLAADGDLGIGTTAPTALLHVSSSGDEALFQVDGATSGTILYVTGNLGGTGGALGVGTANPEYRIDTGDDASTVRFGQLAAGAWPASTGYAFLGHESQDHTSNNWYSLNQSAGGETSINSATGKDLYFRIGHAIKAVVNSDGNFGIGPNAGHPTYWEPASLLHVSSSGDGSLFQVQGATAGTILFVTGSGKIGVNTTTPLVSLDVHYTGSGDPRTLDDDTGGGEVVYFGTSSASGLQPGALYYLNSNGGWASASAGATGSDPVNGGGHNQLLALSLGNDPDTDGMLLRGFFHADSYYEGNFEKGGPVYTSTSSANYKAFPPTASDNFVRIIGYGTDTGNVIYFNPDATYVEIEGNG